MTENPYDLLKGVRILELTTYVAAPSGGRLLADWGADIIKVEATPRGDVTRYVVPLPGMQPITYQFHNANKKSICLNLKTKEGQEIMHRLLKTANVFFTNTRSAALKKLGLDYETLHERYPGLIHAQITGYGEAGEKANAPGFDNVCYWALGGAMYACMEKGTAPIIPPSSFGDHNAACTMAGAICAALYKQKATGEGSKIVTSLYSQVLYNMTEPIISIQCSNLDTYPKTRLENTPLNNTYVCGDGKWIMVCCHEYERYFPDFMSLIGREDLIENSEYNTFAKGNERSREIIGILSDAFQRFTREDLEKELTDRDIPHAVLTNVPDLLESQQAWENKYLRKFNLHTGEEFIEAQTPVKFGGVTEAPRKDAPYLGEQSTVYLKELGYSEEEIEELKKKEIVIEKTGPFDRGGC
ncbi:MAG: CoA transferase [Ndongobacter sp.]|nr:CoA transferase [Ndongobacter sp.]